MQYRRVGDLQNDYVEAQSPPSSYAVAAAVDGEPGAWSRVLLVTFARAFVIAPGLYLGGIRGTKLLTGAAMASTTITAMLFALYGMKKHSAPRYAVEIGQAEIET